MISKFARDGLVVSLPAAELQRLTVRSSVCALSELDVDCLSKDLSWELKNLLNQLSLPASKVRVVVRPEIFTNGETHRWLEALISPATHHICITDGDALKWLSLLDNSFYFYTPYRSASMRKFRRLRSIAPELITLYRSQINSAVWPIGKSFPEIMLFQDKIEEERGSVFYPVLFDKVSYNNSTRHQINKPYTKLPDSDVDVIIIVDLTPTSLEDSFFIKELEEIIFQVLFDKRRVLILVASAHHFGYADTQERAEAVLQCLMAKVNDMPQVLAQNVFIASASMPSLLTPSSKTKFDLVMHDSSAFWRQSANFYSLFRTITVIVGSKQEDQTLLEELYAAAMGREVHLRISTAADQFDTREQAVL